jgi:hypothetical protein
MGATDNMASYMKLYRERNRARINKYAKQYYHKRKEHLSQRIDCMCGGFFQKWNKNAHEKGKKHINFCVKNGYKHYEWVEKNGKNILDENDINTMTDYIYGEIANNE